MKGGRRWLSRPSLGCYVLAIVRFHEESTSQGDDDTAQPMDVKKSFSRTTSDLIE